MEIGSEAAQFPEKEYINGIFLAVQFGASHKKNCGHRWVGGNIIWVLSKANKREFYRDAVNWGESYTSWR